MAHVFHITSANNRFEMNPDGQGSVSFTVSNASGRPLRARAVIVPLGGTEAGWLTVEGDAERQLSTNGTEIFVVRAAVAQGTAAGDYTFRLDVVSEENPDEDFVEGPPVAMQVQSSEVPKRKFPLWILFVVLGVLVVGGLAGLVIWLATRGEPTVPEVVGSTLSEARDLIEGVGMKIDGTPPRQLLR